MSRYVAASKAVRAKARTRCVVSATRQVRHHWISGAVASKGTKTTVGRAKYAAACAATGHTPSLRATAAKRS